MRRRLIAVKLLLSAACSSPTGIPGTALTVLAKGGSLQLEDHSDRRIFWSWEAVPGPANQAVPGPVQAVVVRL